MVRRIVPKGKAIWRDVQRFISKNIKILRKEDYPHTQAIAIAHSMARKEFPEFRERLKRNLRKVI